MAFTFMPHRTSAGYSVSVRLEVFASTSRSYETVAGFSVRVRFVAVAETLIFTSENVTNESQRLWYVAFIHAAERVVDEIRTSSILPLKK